MSPTNLHLFHQAFFGGVAAIGFAVLFNCRPQMLAFAFGAGLLTLGTRTFFLDHGFTLPAASFFAALLAAVIDRLWKDNPSPRGSLLAFIGSIPMIPGGAAARVLLGLFVVLRSGPAEAVGEITAIWENMITIVFTLGAIGTALALPSLFQPAAPTKRESSGP
jgi:uncharacterized membrane protein YjjB (DUF3815 family)